MFTSHLFCRADRLVDTTNLQFNWWDVNVAPKKSPCETFNSPVSEAEMLTSRSVTHFMGVEHC